MFHIFMNAQMFSFHLRFLKNYHFRKIILDNLQNYVHTYLKMTVCVHNIERIVSA